MNLFGKRSIRGKIVAVIVMVNFLTITSMTIFMVLDSISTFKEDVLNRHIIDAQMIGEYCASGIQFGDSKVALSNLSKLDSIPYIVNGILFSPNGEVFVAHHKMAPLIPPPEFYNLSHHIFSDSHLQIYEPITMNAQVLGVIYLRISTEQLQQKINRHILFRVIILLVVLTLSLVLANWFQRLISKPILDLAQATRNITDKEDFAVKLEHKTNDEIGILYHNFSQMLEQILLRKSERDKAEEALRESEQRLHKITTSANDAILLVDNKGYVSFWNQAAERLWGYSETDILGQNLQVLIVATEKEDVNYANFHSFLNQVNGEQGGNSFELIALKRNGEQFPIELSVASLKIKDHWHWVGIAKNIIERKTYEQELKNAKDRAEKADRLKSAFLANLSHEIRTPMNAIVGFTELLRSPDTPPDKQSDYLDIVQDSSYALLDMIGDILDISRLESEQMELHITDFQLSIIVQQIIRLAENKKSKTEKHLIEFKTLSDSRIDAKILIKGDEVRIKKILSNLIDNAFKFTSKGFVEFGYQLQGENKLLFHVTDTGIGMSKQKQQGIFDRFYQVESGIKRQYGGLGLGLAICKGLAELMGGEIWVESVVDKGSTFYFQLPLERALKTNVPEVTDVIYTQTDNLVLIVEDEDSNSLLLEELLTSMDIPYLRAYDGKKAVEMCLSNDNITLVFMDLQMPIMNGFEATKQIKAVKEKLPIIAQTAFDTPEIKQQSTEIGFNDYLTKPLSMREVTNAIDKYIKKV